MIQEEIKAHEELHKKIYDCKRCCPTGNEKYCGNCKKAILDFMDKYGAGVLTRDEIFEELQDKIKNLEKENKKLTKKLAEKIKQLELRKKEKPYKISTEKKQIERDLKITLRIAMGFCKKLGILGINTKIAKNYVEFSFKPIKETCKECGKET